MHELTINLHMHTYYSDGHASHAEIAQAALQAGLDAAIVTDHNVWVNGMEQVCRDGDRQTLLLVGEEIHDQARSPQKNHLLVFGAGRELAPLAPDTQRLLDAVKQAGGVAFAAHPFDPAAPAFGETDITWEAWDATGLTGLELWNGMSEFKERLRSPLHAVYYALQPRKVARGPRPETLKKWDELLAQGNRVVAVGGSDAHAMRARLGPLRRILFPYVFHFQAINTHLLVPEPLSGDLVRDSRAILEALRQGHAFVGYDLPAPTHGFRFKVQGSDGVAWMGDEARLGHGVTLQVRLPRRAECLLIKDGKLVRRWLNRDTCTHIATEPGVYRVEVYIHYQGRRRGWIFSNPIYVV